jgi:hypothetical protein
VRVRLGRLLLRWSRRLDPPPGGAWDGGNVFTGPWYLTTATYAADDTGRYHYTGGTLR